jgi:hypothetical protein
MSSREDNVVRWIKAQNIQEGDTVLFSIYEVKVSSVDSLVGTDKLTITTDTGHKHTLKTWQDVQVLCEQKGRSVNILSAAIALSSGNKAKATNSRGETIVVQQQFPERHDWNLHTWVIAPDGERTYETDFQHSNKESPRF